MYNSAYIIKINYMIAYRMAQDNPAQRMEEQQQNLQHHRETRSDPESWAQ